MEDLGFSYIHKHKVWLHIPTSSLIFIYELDMYSYDEIHTLVFERTGENPSEWLIEALKMPLYSDI
jgi:hypothetical protein